MSCICQYCVPLQHRTITDGSTNDNSNNKVIEPNAEDKPIISSNDEVSATDLAAARAEIWLLTKNLSEAHISIENLENFIKTIIEKQNIILTEMYHLKRSNFELQEECRIQRDYHTMERNTMITELRDIKSLLHNRSKLLEETVLKNMKLANAVQDANEKMYIMGLKYIKSRSSRFRQESENFDYSSDPEDSE